MPITLTKPYSPGDNAPGQSYNQAQITSVHINLQAAVVMFTYEIGNETKADDGTTTWKLGDGTAPKTVHVAGDDFKELGTVPTQSNESVYAAVKRSLYQYLINKNLVAGTIA